MVTVTTISTIYSDHPGLTREPAGAGSRFGDFLPGRPILAFREGLSISDLARSLAESTYTRPVPVWLRRERQHSPVPVVITALSAVHDFDDESINYWKAEGYVAGADDDARAAVRIAASGTKPAESGEIESYQWQIASDDPIASEEEYVVIRVDRRT